MQILPQSMWFKPRCQLKYNKTILQMFYFSGGDNCNETKMKLF